VWGKTTGIKLVDSRGHIIKAFLYATSNLGRVVEEEEIGVIHDSTINTVAAQLVREEEKEMLAHSSLSCT